MSGVDAITAAASASISQAPSIGIDTGAIAAPASVPSASFGQFVGEGMAQVNQALLASQSDLQSLALGNAQNLHQVMMRLEETRLSFQLMMQVRSRVLEAYQDVMKMQV
ncbi:flagellar hook-basal body complex protein FliE [Trinickia diaoshuihuensis]|jgi:flagellar hook-basal body complex protein FliE|uniref:flagellar hook-basal body complex protein FliE n=1 Tax=Trinickia diaoshuihuensis TaxID=2292265 RepID=UPI000E2279C2|nr:flagellar hook-basal body complex protein FliE [Trinickia diaoshuihuensis]